MPGTYASTTDTSSDASLAEIKRNLFRFGADEFAHGEDRTGATIGFVLRGRHFRFRMQLPNRTDRRFTHTDQRRLPRSKAAQEREYETAVRQRWRSLALVIKALLAGVDDGILTFEEAFLPYTLMPDGRTVAEHTLPAVAETYATGAQPALLPGPGPRE